MVARIGRGWHLGMDTWHFKPAAACIWGKQRSPSNRTALGLGAVVLKLLPVGLICGNGQGDCFSRWELIRQALAIG